MKKFSHFGVGKFFLVRGCLLPSLFFSEHSQADTILLKNGKSMKGLVVEKHADRVILSTENGEVPVLSSDTENIEYNDPEQNFLENGKSFEEAGKLDEALAYYEKALQINPNLEEAQAAAMGIRNRFWAKTTEGPRGEVDKHQILYDAWGQGKPVEKKAAVENENASEIQSLRQSMGLLLEKKGDWVRLEWVDSKKPAALAGLKKNDRMVAIDGKSLRFLTADSVRKNFLTPLFSNFTLEFERDCFLHKEAGKPMDLKELGFKVKLEYQGVRIEEVRPESAAAESGLKEGDLLTEVGQEPTRYMPLKKVIELIESSREDRVILTVRRPTLLSRN